jgi:hypothetical protein
MCSRRLVRKRLLALAISTVFALGCGSMDVRDATRMKSLDVTLNNYDKLIRWSLFSEAARYVRPRSVDAPGVDVRHLQGVHVTQLTPVTQGLSDDRMEARVRNRIDYYWDDSGVIRSLTDDQVWWYDEASHRWYLDGSLPAFVK